VSGSGDKTARIWDMATGSCVFDLRIEDMVQGEIGPIDAGITSVAREYRSGGPHPRAWLIIQDVVLCRQSLPIRDSSLLVVWIRSSEYGTP